MPSSFHFAKKPSKGIESLWKSYLTQTVACREQLDESMTEADKPIGLKTAAGKQLDESMTEADEMAHLRLMSTVSARDSFRC